MKFLAILGICIFGFAIGYFWPVAIAEPKVTAPIYTIEPMPILTAVPVTD